MSVSLSTESDTFRNAKTNYLLVKRVWLDVDTLLYHTMAAPEEQTERNSLPPRISRSPALLVPAAEQGVHGSFGDSERRVGAGGAREVGIDPVDLHR